MAANVSSLSVTVTSNTTSGTIRIPFTVVVVRDHFSIPGMEFLAGPNSGFIALQLPSDGPFQFSNSEDLLFFDPNTVPEIETDPNRGVAYVIRDQVVYNYNLVSPVTEPYRVSFDISLFVEGPGSVTAISRIPFFSDIIEIIPPGTLTFRRIGLNVNVV